MTMPVKQPPAAQSAIDARAARWFVAHTQPNAEARAVLNLERQGFATYLPRYLKRRRHARRVDIFTHPTTLCFHRVLK